VIEDEIVGWHHQLIGHEVEQTLIDSEGQGSLAFRMMYSVYKLNKQGGNIQP